MNIELVKKVNSDQTVRIEEVTAINILEFPLGLQVSDIAIKIYFNTVVICRRNLFYEIIMNPTPRELSLLPNEYYIS